MQFQSIICVYILILCSFVIAIQDEDTDNDNIYIDVHQHPKSGFSCEGKKVGEYYTDLTTNCQLYYVCLPNAQLKLSPTSFACPNTTRFNQATRVCSPADQVYCNIAERYYENIHGSIDSKDHRPNEYLGADFDKTPWQINKQKTVGKSVIVPLNLEPEYKVQSPRPSARALPKIETQTQPKSDPHLHNSFALTFNNPQSTSTVHARNRNVNTINTNSKKINTLDNLQNSQPLSNRFKSSINTQNSRSRLPIHTSSGRNTIISPTTIATTSTTTTTTTTTTVAPLINDSPKDPKSSDYIYDYVEYDAPTASNQPNNQPTNLKPALLPTLPVLDHDISNHNTDSSPKTNVGESLFNNAINHQALNNQQTPRILQSPNQSNSSRPPQRNQLPQTNSLNYFNSNPFASNPFSSNSFSSNLFSNSNNNPSHIRQKREQTVEEFSSEHKKANYGPGDIKFSCIDKLPGIRYADIQSKCIMFHICLPLSKGKYKDYQLFCESGQGFNQFTSNCEPQGNFDCKRSKDYYLYNKQINLHSYLKNKSRISKQLADIKN